jgi:hypothetical protein
MKLKISDISPRLEVKAARGVDGVLSYDIDNAYPQRVKRLINGSPTGSQAVQMLAKYIEGGGFVNQSLDSLKVNKHLTLPQLVRQIAKDFSPFNGFAIHVNYNALLQPFKLSVVPFEYCRLTDDEEDAIYPNMIAVYDDWDKDKRTRYKMDEIEYYHTFNPDKETVREQIEAAGGISKYKGQILYWTNAAHRCYPLSRVDSVLEELDNESQMMTFKNNSLRKGYMADYMIVTKQEFESDDEYNDFVSKINNSRGADGKGNFFVIEGENPESVPEFVKIDSTLDDKVFVNWTKDSSNAIRKTCNNIPPVLIYYVEGQLGNTSGESIQQASIFYNAMTSEERAVVSYVLREVFMHIPRYASESFEMKPLSWL